jgi:hypothetical protein
MSSFVPLARYWNEQVKDDFGEEYSTFGGEEECIQSFGLKNRKKDTTGKA